MQLHDKKVSGITIIFAPPPAVGWSLYIIWVTLGPLYRFGPLPPLPRIAGAANG